jgi:hypothetical protein
MYSKRLLHIGRYGMGKDTRPMRAEDYKCTGQRVQRRPRIHSKEDSEAGPSSVKTEKET